MDARLLTAIGKPKIQSQASELVQLALAALSDLTQLDEGLYERFVASRVAPHDRAATEAGLRALWMITFRGLSALLAHCQKLIGERPPTEPIEPIDPLEAIDWGDLEGDGDGGGDRGADTAPVAQTEDELDLGSADFGELLDGIDEQAEVGDAERWTKVVASVESIEYGLRSQLAEASARLDVAFGAGEIGQVLGLLDDTQSSAAEGVHALVSAVYAAFVPDVDPATIVPGFLTSLSRALLVRRGLSELSGVLAPSNAALQGKTPDPAALVRVRAALHEFVGSAVCRAMRPADRWQLVEIERELATQPIAVARLTSEGLVKYLESLGSINQREVLVTHDRHAIDDLRESLANARQLVDLSPRTASEMMDRAHDAAQRLAGRHPLTDQLINELEWYVPVDGTTAEITAFLERLEGVLIAAAG